MRISDWSSDVCSSDLGNAIRKVDRPLHDLHAPERSTDHGGPAPDAEHVGQQRLRAHPVAHRQQWKIRAVRLAGAFVDAARRSEEHTSELQSLMRTSYAVFCLKKKKKHHNKTTLKRHPHIKTINKL